MLFTNEQTLTWQNEIIDGARRTGELDQLVWFIQMISPLTKAQARSMTQAERIAARYRTACGPADWVPYIEVAPDPVATRQDAELLAAIFAGYNPPAIKFAPALALRTDLHQVRHYEFGREWDCICARCGQIFPNNVPDVDLCPCCEIRLRPPISR